MLPNSCRSVTNNGQPCGCYAVRHSEFCRHHQPRTPKDRSAHPGAPHRPAPQPNLDPSPRPNSPPPGAFTTARFAPPPDLESLQADTETVLAALGARKISHRSAGRILQAIEDRRAQLLEDQILAQLILQEHVEAIQNARPTG